MLLKYEFSHSQIFFFIFVLIHIQDMISASRSKLIRSLRQKKYRDKEGLFVMEGEKMVRELLRSHPSSAYRIRELFASPEWLEKHKDLLSASAIQIHESPARELKKVSTQTSPQGVLALIGIPEGRLRESDIQKEAILAFESIRDPGNLGTIIRTADWFGIRALICSPDSTDAFNPKVVQASMGAIIRVQVHYLDLEALLSASFMKEKEIFGTYLSGPSLYETKLGAGPLILFGNESRGISDKLSRHIPKRISIPGFSQSDGPESLNLASTTAIICSELRRNAG